MPNDVAELFKAAQNGDLIKIKDLIEQGTYINEQYEHSKLTALHVACEYGHLHIVKFLTKEVKVLILQDIVGRTALHVAAQFGHFHIVKFLIEEKIQDVDKKDIDRHTALHLAMQKSHWEIVEYLIWDAKRDTHTQKDLEYTLLSHPYFRNDANFETLKILIRKIVHSNFPMQKPVSLTPEALEQLRIKNESEAKVQNQEEKIDAARKLECFKHISSYWDDCKKERKELIKASLPAIEYLIPLGTSNLAHDCILSHLDNNTIKKLKDDYDEQRAGKEQVVEAIAHFMNFEAENCKHENIIEHIIDHHLSTKNIKNLLKLINENDDEKNIHKFLKEIITDIVKKDIEKLFKQKDDIPNLHSMNLESSSPEHDNTANNSTNKDKVNTNLSDAEVSNAVNPPTLPSV